MSLLGLEDYGIGSNFQEQKDELLALESIFADRPDSFKYEVIANCGTSNIQGVINVHLPEFDKSILIKKNAIKAFEVKYLPPLKLRFNFPHNYPSSVPPFFSLDALWLEADLAQRLTASLKNLWQDYSGMPILFTWVQALEEEIMKDIINSGIINLDCVSAIEPDCGEGCSKYCETIDTVRELKDYQERAAQESFEKGWFDCEVCFGSHSGLDSVRFSPCGHVFCIECVSAFYHQQLKDLSTKRLECLTDGCESFASHCQLRQVLTPSELERYENLLLECALDLMSDVVTCPRVSCQAPVLLETMDENSTQSRSVFPGRCSVCNYAFCVLCKKTYHGLQPCCMDPEVREKVLVQYSTASPEEKEIIHRRFGGKANFLRELETMKSNKWIDKNSNRCPKCNVAIEKNAGCNKMLCIKCGQPFCWLCHAALPSSFSYDHYSVKGTECYRRLFEGVEVSDEEDDEIDVWFDVGDADSSDEQNDA